MSTAVDLYGLMAEFEHPEELLDAARRAHDAGYRKMGAYAPIPVEGLSAVMGHARTRLPVITFIGGVLGGLTGYLMQYYASVIHYPLNVGGRPLHSWPAFLPITFELTVLGAALFTVLAILGLNGLPTPYHPVFNVPAFKLATRNRFFLSIQTRDPRFALGDTRSFLESLHPLAIHEVPR
jgi:hypothetical protein